jgi:hypothetical protein
MARAKDICKYVPAMAMQVPRAEGLIWKLEEKDRELSRQLESIASWE